jgi:Family of unknown function (DUF5678)
MNEPSWGPLEQRMLEDLRWARTAPEVRQHQGQLVVVRNKRVVAHGTDRPALVAHAAAMEGCPDYELIVVVVPPDGPWEIPH